MKAFSIAALFFLAFFIPEKKRIKIFMAGDSTMSVKEVKAYPETGWGMPFAYAFDSTVTVDNRAKNGRSTKTFISEGLWQKLIDDVHEGDYVFIQFGHNDEVKEKVDRYTTPDEYSANLGRFISETRNKKANPILFTPVARRKFENEQIVETHEEYAALVRKVAKQYNVPLIDMDSTSKVLLQQYGEENSKSLFLHLQPGEHPNYPDGKVDNTHFNYAGAKKMAQIALEGIKELHLELADRILQYPSKFIVAQDGSGDFKTIQEAIFAARDLSQQQVTVLIRKGVYREKLIVPSWKTNITLIGESRDSTIITYDDHAGKKLTVRDQFLKTDTLRTYTSYTVLVQGNDCRIQNLTIKNTAGRVGQAVALHVEGDRFVAINCVLNANQDTLYVATQNSRQYYQDCFIEGTVDFIFGEATAVFKNCTIKSLNNSYITAASTRPAQPYGFVFFDCKLIADTAAVKVYLGRPWRPYSKTVFINTWMGSHILKEGWDNWRNAENEKTVLYAEYNSAGPGANKTDRVKWSKQLSKSEVKKYTIRNIFAGWDPQSK